MAFWIPLALGGLGLARGVGQARQARGQRKVEATKARFSPFTGIAPQPVQQPDVFGSALQGATAGLMLEQALTQAAAPTGLATGGQAQPLGLQGLGQLAVPEFLQTPYVAPTFPGLQAPTFGSVLGGARSPRLSLLGRS